MDQGPNPKAQSIDMVSKLSISQSDQAVMGHDVTMDRTEVSHFHSTRPNRTPVVVRVPSILGHHQGYFEYNN